VIDSVKKCGLVFFSSETILIFLINADRLSIS
jgi:hypothetical protein